MTTSETKDRATGATKSVRNGAGGAIGAARDAASGAADQVRAGASTAAEAVPEVVSMIRGGVDGVAERLPDALEAARTGAAATADSLREMPQPTLRVLAALSIGMGLGLYVAGAPRLVTIAALTPALLAGLTVVANESARPAKG
jgi:uncharacterized protein YjbJ (UPF0337 family)